MANDRAWVVNMKNTATGRQYTKWPQADNQDDAVTQAITQILREHPRVNKDDLELIEAHKARG